MERKKVIVTESIAEEGLALLRSELEVDFRKDISRAELLEIIDQYDALIVRSVTKVNEELIQRGTRLKVVGRAGNGVDNIDVDVCTRYGIIVANTPDSNTISAAEQTISLLLSSVRNTAWASDVLKKSGTWDRSPFRGTELYGKTVGIVGLGRIGSMVATRLKSFNMKVIAYDPYIANERFERFGAEKKATLEDLVREADIITVHTPRNEETMHMVNEDVLELAKPGVRLVNCARGGIISETAILKGLESGKIASAGLDVYEKEPAEQNPLFRFTNVVCTPHLGADTYEAQKRVGENIAEQVIKALQGGIVPNVVNLPSVLGEELDYLHPYITLAEKMGNIYYQIAKSPISRVEITYSGPITINETEMLTIGLLKGLLEPVLWEKVNYVNARLMAEDRGIKLYETKEAVSPKRYKNLILVKIFNHEHQMEFAGTLSRARNPLLVEIDGYETETTLEGYVLMVENEDRPRVIGPFATALGDEGVNIAGMKVARHGKGERAIMIINVDNKVEEEALDRLAELDGILGRPILLHF
ncbi:MAG: phosphoglycerate dehydrogenase [Syntrophomonadaceae bacterium]|nr:phosphoglycerate dehydrogenase [Syntrophomonadaceae bacterium]